VRGAEQRSPSNEPYPGRVQIVLTLFNTVHWRGVPITGTRAQTLLQVLAAAGSRGESAESLVRSVWGDNPPRNSVKGLHVLVSRVRSATAAQGIERTTTGYRLGLAREEVDVLAHADLETKARDALARQDVDTAATVARKVLDLGPSDTADRVLAIAYSRF